MQLAAALQCWRQALLAIVFAFAVLFYIAVMNGPVGDVKYRLPVEPIPIVLAAALSGSRLRSKAPPP
ncbi:MAG: hypothetical protein GKR94_32030 [Gammaproteobacteria bacterium]|nr:hypothetical protein [Gammaproteobacteria bacterium]